MKRPYLPRVMELALIAAIVGAISASLAPVVSPSRQRPLKQACIDNLRRIGQAARMYADDYDGYIYPQVYADAYWGMPAGVAPPASATFAANIWATALLPYCGNATDIFRCPFENAKEHHTDQGDVSYKYEPGIPPSTPESGKRVSYIYVGLDLWSAGFTTLRDPAQAFRYKRRITDVKTYLIPGSGWLARDKDFTIGNHLATSHSVSPFPTTDSANWIKGVESNVLLMDGQVKTYKQWDG